MYRRCMKSSEKVRFVRNTFQGALFLYYRKVLAEIKLCKLMILPKEGIENRR